MTMITKADWNAAFAGCIAAEREAQRREMRARVLPIAAGILIAIGGALLVPRREAAPSPYVHSSRYELDEYRSRGSRGVEPVQRLPRGEQRYLLSLPVDPTRAYRVEIVNLRGEEPKVVWSAHDVRASGDDLELSVPHDLLEGGLHRIDVYGDEPEPLASYRVEIAK
jgi:hypothetical protein